jgi:hypothetical protein
MSVDSAFTAGAIVGAVVVSTFLLIRFIRYVALIAATMAIVVVSLRGGVAELIGYVDALEGLVGTAPTFSAGIIGGGLLVALIRAGRERRRAAE